MISCTHKMFGGNLWRWSFLKSWTPFFSVSLIDLVTTLAWHSFIYFPDTPLTFVLIVSSVVTDKSLILYILYFLIINLIFSLGQWSVWIKENLWVFMIKSKTFAQFSVPDCPSLSCLLLHYFQVSLLHSFIWFII